MNALRSLSLALTLSTVALSAQTPPEGYASTVTNLPSTASMPLVLGASTVYFTGNDLILSASGGKRSLLTFPKQVFGSFLIPITKDTLLFGESSNGGIWLVPMTTSGKPRQLNSIKFNYAAVVYDANYAIVSAKTGGFGAQDNDLIAIHLATGVLDPIAKIPGASGPLAIDRSKNLYYASGSAKFPAPKKSVEILRFSAQRVATAFGSTALAKTDAAIVYKGLDAAGSMVLDNDHDLLMTDWMNSSIVELSDVHTATPKASMFANYKLASLTASSLRFVPGTQPGFGLQEFEAFQPQGGGTLWIHESAFGGTSRLRHVRTVRPTTSVSTNNPVPASTAFRIQVQAGPAGGQGVIALGLGSYRREVFAKIGHEQPIFWADSLLAPIYLQAVTFDAKGAASLALFNPGFQKPLSLTAQSFLVSSGTMDAGSSAPLPLTLR